MLPKNVKTLANYIEEAGYETAYIGNVASDGEFENRRPSITMIIVPKELRGGYTGIPGGKAGNTSHDMGDGYV